MKRKNILIAILSCLLCLLLAACLVACGDKAGSPPQGTQPQPEPVPPTAAEIVAARERASQNAEQNYDFSLNFSGTLSSGIIQGTANANYEGSYRFNKTTNALSFKRITSGALLYDSQEYIINEGSSRLKIKCNEDGVVKKVAVQSGEDELTLINLPFVALIDALDAENIINIDFNNSGSYKYKANIRLTAENPALEKLYSIVGKMDTSISLKDVTFTNPASGVLLQFDLEDGGMLTNFTFGAEIKFPVKGVDTKLSLTYKQSANSSAINVPAYDKLIYGAAKVAPEIDALNAAIAAYKKDNAYSLDLEAENDFDPGWKVSATVDKYIARMYKNVNELKDGATLDSFNKSYYYRNHTEQSGKEKYKYTEGNVIEDNAVWRISRSGRNTHTQLDGGITSNSVFDEMTSYFVLDASAVDCIEKTQKNGKTMLDIHINDAKVIALINSIVALINSNPTTDEGVIKAENYLNTSEYSVKDAEFVVTMSNGKVESISFESKLRYSPTDGDYTENNITLKNTLLIKFNEELSKAQGYEAPDKVGTPGLSGLSAGTKYIL